MWYLTTVWRPALPGWCATTVPNLISFTELLTFISKHSRTLILSVCGIEQLCSSINVYINIFDSYQWEMSWYIEVFCVFYIWEYYDIDVGHGVHLSTQSLCFLHACSTLLCQSVPFTGEVFLQINLNNSWWQYCSLYMPLAYTFSKCIFSSVLIVI